MSGSFTVTDSAQKRQRHYERKDTDADGCPKVMVKTDVSHIAPPTIAAMVSNFGFAVSGWAKAGFKVVERDAFDKRLTICRGCSLWDENARFGMGKCNHGNCGCTKAKHWLQTERCPAGKW